MRGTAVVIAVFVLLASSPQTQEAQPATPLTLVAREGRRPVRTTLLNGREFIALEDVRALFQVSVREDTLAGGLTVTYRGQTIVASTDQPMASVSGRVVALPAPPIRSGQRWLVPLEFLSRALAPIYDERIDLRRASRLLIVGDLRVPRVTARIDAPGPPTRATIEITPAAPVIVTVEPGRVVARIDADALDLALPRGGDGLIERMGPGNQPNTVAVALASRAGIARVTEVDSDTLARVTIEVPARATPAPTAAAPPALPVPPPPASPPSSALSIARRPVLETIVIDPGHGGADPGTRSAGGVAEKEITLEVARRLRTLIESRLGIRVALTRDEDRTVTLDERAAMANNSKAGLFLSLHVNAALRAGVAGAEVFHLKLDREGENALRAADVRAVSLPVLGGASRTIDVIPWDLAQARHVEASAVFARLLAEELRAAVRMGPRPLQDAPLRVLAGANMPAALVEMGYLSNGGQANLVRSEGYQASLAQAMYNAVLRFRTHLEELGLP